MAGIDAAINKAEAFDSEQRAAEESTETTGTGQPTTAPDVDKRSLEAAAEMAESLLKTGEKIMQAFVDQRLVADELEVARCGENVGPLLDKYNLTGGGGGLPYQEEMAAGFYFGGLIKRFRRALAELRKADKAKKQEKETNGNQREHQTSQPSRAVSGEVGVREKSDASKEGWNTESWGESGAMGQQQGSSST